MRRAIGITTSGHVVAGVVEERRLVGLLRVWPEDGSGEELHGMPTEAIAQQIHDEVVAVAQGRQIDVVGVGTPGIIRCGVIEDSPNLQQMKGFRIEDALTSLLRSSGIEAQVRIFNDADVIAAGLAATRDQLDRLTRVWLLGSGIGFGRFPFSEGVWEGGHMVVSLDPHEKYCGCGGRGHLEGIMGHRAMRLRFLDLEPDEIFENAQKGDDRCAAFVRLWHRALAAATATAVHLEGPGKFFVTGPNAKRLDVPLLNRYMHEMVKMSPLQGYVFEVVPGGEEIAVIGGAVNALRSAFPEET